MEGDVRESFGFFLLLNFFVGKLKEKSLGGE